MAIIGNLYKVESLFKEKKFAVVFDYFKQVLDPDNKIHKRLKALSSGSCEKYMLNDDIFVLEQVFYTKNRSECFIESHKKYVDFQLIVSGAEQMEYIDIDKVAVDQEYDEATDFITYKIVDNTSKFLLESGDLAVYFPDDGHVGLAMYEKPLLVHKAVIKVPVTLFD
ncbi:YhcH/YjgK/YiaL family protein [Sulfurimonas microaerophilic]|uniref:YhcH/YjgK/YiaL family protein n=1 Tax=Sulfurimonas microaerophilic TaxID=3058392 RepID=UPI002714521B|nr:YhcH/YjgK/YiaL family protein [Sulfurimonas sp. hsl 1-7]